jgi:serine/threonine-protein kinase RsbW
MVMASSNSYDWDRITFASTLFLCPVLDKILAYVPQKWQAEIRLGLQEALVNAAKHGNNLDPQKQVIVSFCLKEGEYWWVITDEGVGFQFPCGCNQEIADRLPEAESESGRGMSMLHQIFDRVVWNHQGTELRLCKQLSRQTAKEKEPVVC